MRWTVLIPAKALPGAKSRLAPMSADAASHRRLVEAIRADTVAAARAAAPVARVLVVVDTLATDGPDVAWPDGVEVLVQSGTGLNEAIAEGAAHAAAAWPLDGVAALVGDLPALQPGELASALDAATGLGAGFVPDAAGTGTTLLASVPGTRLVPRFGVGSAARHSAGAARIDAAAGLRLDVDTAADLQDAAARLGVGAATAAVLTELGVTVRSTCLGMIAP